MSSRLRAAVHGALPIACALFAVSFPVRASAAWEEAPAAFVVLSNAGPASLRAFANDLSRAGGHVAVIYPPRAAVVFADDAALAAPEAAAHVAAFFRGPVAAPLASFGAETERAARAWEASLVIEASGGIDERAFAERTPWPDARRRPVPLGTSASSKTAVSDNMPYGAEYYDTSEFLAGTSAVGVWLLEAAGTTYEWTSTEVNQTVGGVQAGLANWVRKGGAPAFLTFTLDIHTGVPVSGVPIEQPMSNDHVWVNEVLGAAGYAGANGFEKCFAYNNALRDLYDTNWCYSIFIVDSNSLVNQGLFSGGGYAWAYFGGPWVYMSRFSTWAYNHLRYYGVVPMHETGHIFMDTDEYNGVMEYGGYLNAPDDPSTGVVCIMNMNDSTRVCPETRNQLAWRDLDFDGIIEPLDVPPSIALDPSLPDPTTDATPTWNGSSSVAVLDNLNPLSNYMPPHDQTIATIAAVEGRADGGAWTPAAPADGAFDEYVEAYSWTAPPLAGGQHVVETRAMTSAGAWSAISAPDTITIETLVAVDGSVPAPLTVAASPNPMHGGASVSYTIPVPGVARLDVYAIDGRRVRTLLAASRSAGAGNTSWDATDDAGRRLPCGLYIVRLSTMSGSAMAKIVVME